VLAALVNIGDIMERLFEFAYINLYVIYSQPMLRVVVIGLVVFVFVATITKRMWVYCLVAVILLALCAYSSIWVLQLGWGLAAIGAILIVVGFIWRLISYLLAQKSDSLNADTHLSFGLILPGLGLLAAPFVNVFFLMPILRTTMGG
jgi:hypothetical protein